MEEFKSRGGLIDTKFLSIIGGQVYLSTGLRKHIGKPGYTEFRASFEIDKQNKLIAMRIEEGESDRATFKVASGGYAGAKLNRELPTGRYEFKEEKEGRYIFEQK